MVINRDDPRLGSGDGTPMKSLTSNTLIYHGSMAKIVSHIHFLGKWFEQNYKKEHDNPSDTACSNAINIEMTLKKLIESMKRQDHDLLALLDDHPKNK